MRSRLIHYQITLIHGPAVCYSLQNFLPTNLVHFKKVLPSFKTESTPIKQMLILQLKAVKELALLLVSTKKWCKHQKTKIIIKNLLMTLKTNKKELIKQIPEEQIVI